MSEGLVLDNSKRSTFCSCKMKYFLQHIKGLQPDFGSTALRYGSTWHAIQEGYYGWIIKNGWPNQSERELEAITTGLTKGKEKWDIETSKKQFIDDYKNFNTAVDAFQEYLRWFESDHRYMTILGTEKKFECPILPDNKLEEEILSKLPPITFTGKMDLQVMMDHLNWIFDFKTTGWRLDQVTLKANRSPQLIGYSYAAKHVLDYETSGCLCSFAYIGSRKNKAGDWGKVNFEFQRIPQVYTDGDIAAWKLSFIDTCSDILHCEEMDVWPQSFDNCYQYGRCPYLKLCHQHVPFEDLNTEGFHVDFWNVLEED